jgi:ribosomal protein S18 acetylase RimI-like enzyme
MDVIIRKATLDDLSTIQELNLMLFKKEYEKYDKTLDLNWTEGKEGTGYFKKRITDENSCALVAIVDGEIVGYRVGAISKPESYRILSSYAEAENMFVLSEFRNKGIGTKLFNEFVKWCKEKGVKRVKLVVSSENKKALGFDRKLGFQDHSITLEKEIED